MNNLNIISNALLEQMCQKQEKEIGLHGKMGIVLCLYLHSRKIENKQLETQAYNLLDEVVEVVENCDSVSFYNGVTGIGWAIEYLSQRRFLDVDTDEILHEFDNILLQSRFQRVAVHLDQPVFDYGIFFLMRAKKEIEIPLIKKQILTFLVDECMLMLCRNRGYEEKIPVRNLHILNSILYFLSESYRLGINKKNAENALLSNLSYIKATLLSGTVTLSDCLVNAHLISNLPHFERNHGLISQSILEMNDIRKSIIENRYCYRNDITTIAWNNLIYDFHIMDERAIVLINDMMNDIKNLHTNDLINMGLILLQYNK